MSASWCAQPMSSATTSSASSSSSSSDSSSTSSSRESSPVRRTLAIDDDDVRFEGNDPNWPFKPPPGSVPLEHGQADSGEFEWDSLHDNDNDDLDLVLIRVPAAFKAKHLEGAEISINEGGDKASGEVEHKKQTYKITSAKKASTGEASTGGQDMKSLKVLLPRRTIGGQLCLATKQIGSCLTLSGITPQTSTQAEEVLQNPERPRYPLQMLSHSYVPFGVKREPKTMVMPMEMDSTGSKGRSKGKSKKGESTINEGEQAKEKSKKRKKELALEDSGAPKKTKRVKQTA